MTKRVLAVTPGDPEGIGPELLAKIILSKKYDHKKVQLLCVGSIEPFKKLGLKVQLFDPSLSLPKDPETLWLDPAPSKCPKKGLHLPGYQSGWSIYQASQHLKSWLCSALVTGPISKERLQKGGYPFFGHTDFLAHLFNVPEKVTMMLTNDSLTVSLVTVHIPLQDVPKFLTQNLIKQSVLQTVHHLQKHQKIKVPRIGVAALNPHAGENGVLGHQESKIIIPALDHLRKFLIRSAKIEGPLPADTLFAINQKSSKKDRFDAVVCMYHDQGLIPVKLLDFAKTVNVTLGLPVIRTSVDHGTCFDLVGKDCADPSSFENAIRLAQKYADNDV